jgi:hypothetical protein
MADNLEQRIDKALKIARCYGQIDGDHHKTWTIDQMVRALTGCPVVKMQAFGYKNIPYEYEGMGESDEYRRFVEGAEQGDDGPNTYNWDTGIAP